jgi:5'-nucleotidase
MSGASHALTLNHPLRVTAIGPATYIVNGTPTDCVSLALNRLLPERPDLVFSGINRGSNVGYDVTYSGTVSAAFEAALYRVPAIAVSIEAAGDLARPIVAAVVRDLVGRMLGPEPLAPLLNVNLPAGQVHGVRLTVQGLSGYRSEVIEKLDPRGNRYYWIGGAHAHEDEVRPEADIAALRAGYVSVTPLTLDLTDHAAYRRLAAGWNEPDPPGIR